MSGRISSLPVAQELVSLGWLGPEAAARLLATRADAARIIRAMPRQPAPTPDGVCVFRIADSNGGPFVVARGDGEELEIRGTDAERVAAFRSWNLPFHQYLTAAWVSPAQLDQLRALVGWQAREAAETAARIAAAKTRFRAAITPVLDRMPADWHVVEKYGWDAVFTAPDGQQFPFGSWGEEGHAFQRHGYLITPPEWAIGLVQAPEPDVTSYIVEVARGMLAEGQSDVEDQILGQCPAAFRGWPAIAEAWAREVLRRARESR